MGLFEELEKEMSEESRIDKDGWVHFPNAVLEGKAKLPNTEKAEVVEVSSDAPLATQITVWVFAVCLCVVMLAGTWKLLTVWF